MSENVSVTSTWVERCVEKMIAHYTPHFTFSRDIEFAGEKLVLFAEMHNRQQLAILGFRTDRAGPNASEYIFVLSERVFDLRCISRVDALLGEAGRLYVKDDKDQAFTFLSVVVFAEMLEDPAKAALKRRKRTNKKSISFGGWADERIVVVGHENLFICNRDGKALCGLLQGFLR